MPRAAPATSTSRRGAPVRRAKAAGPIEQHVVPVLETKHRRRFGTFPQHFARLAGGVEKVRRKPVDANGVVHKSPHTKTYPRNGITSK